MPVSSPNPQFFAKAGDYRKWLEAHHASAREIWVGFYKVGTGKPTITYKEALDQALCFGWIDGIRKSIDEQAYTIRFTPRKKSSNWSQVNMRRMQELIDEGQMQPAGLRAFEERDQRKVNQYSFEQERVELSAAQIREFRKKEQAWEFFQSQPVSYRRPATWWVVSAKQEATRARRLAQLIADSGAGLRLKQMRPDPKPKRKA